jgi:hypothetical protein
MSNPSREPHEQERDSSDPFADFDMRADASARMSTRRGGRAHESSGGLTQFFLGAAAFCIGTYMLFARVMVTAGITGASMFGVGFGSGPHLGLTLLPFVAGIVVLFVRGNSVLGWSLMAGGLGLLIVQIVASLQMHFLATSLPMVLVIVGLMASGVGLIARSLRGAET